MVGIAPPPTQSRWAKSKWDSLSFASTLYLHPILDTLLDSITHRVSLPVCYELRLGLQEALVNAAKHGNQLNPAKQVSVDYARRGNDYWWVVRDQGVGFEFPMSYGPPPCTEGDGFTEECGRGLFILDQIFDDVTWDQEARALHLRKRLSSRWRWPRRAERVSTTPLELQQGA